MKNKNRAIAFLGIGLLFLASCATKYAPATGSFWDGHTGYSEIALDSTTWQVTFCGNNNTSDDIVNRYALYRSAELTDQRGFDYFVILNDNDVAAITKTVNRNSQQQTHIRAYCRSANGPSSSRRCYEYEQHVHGQYASRAHRYQYDSDVHGPAPRR